MFSIQFTLLVIFYCYRFISHSNHLLLTLHSSHLLCLLQCLPLLYFTICIHLDEIIVKVRAPLKRLRAIADSEEYAMVLDEESSITQVQYKVGGVLSLLHLLLLLLLLLLLHPPHPLLLNLLLFSSSSSSSSSSCCSSSTSSPSFFT